jgi:hypothetical protein
MGENKAPAPLSPIPLGEDRKIDIVHAGIPSNEGRVLAALRLFILKGFDKFQKLECGRLKYN